MIVKADALATLGIQISSRGPNKPATAITWLEAATFINWLNTSNGSQAAYKFNGNNFSLWQPGDSGYNSVNPYRNSLAKYFLPSSDEWYKAAFYNPTAGNYFDYATGSNSAPEAVEFGTDSNTAVYGQVFQTTPPADITLAGGLSPYGTMAQSGNVFEMEETDFDLVNDQVDSPRGARGGTWYWTNNAPGFLSKSFRNSVNPTDQINFLGFRVASVALTADYNFDGVVDQDDLSVWGVAFGSAAAGDADGDDDSDGADFLLWQRNVGDTNTPSALSLASVPEPSSLMLAEGLSLLFVLRRYRRYNSHSESAA
ncbi:MAG: SUMF1/EgtB/PvdO family nonheme iron enzyme [Pirellulales bacterium]